MSTITGTQAITIIVKFPATINNIAEVISKTSLGPWSISVKCSYDSGCHHKSYAYAIELSTKPLVDVLKSAESHSKTFSTSFKPVMNWLKSTLPKFSTTFSTATKAILDILSKVKANGKITPAQRQALTKQFNIIQAGLSTSQKELDEGNTAMAAFVTAQNGFTTAVSKAQNNLEANTQAALSSMIQEADGQPCGQGDARNQYNAIEAQYKNTVNVFNTQFSAFSADTLKASNAVKTLIGIVLDFLAQIKKISEDVKTVQDGNLPIFMQKVTTMAASNLWSELAKQAKEEFGTNSVSLSEATVHLESA